MWQVAGVWDSSRDATMAAVPASVPQLACGALLRLKLSLQACLVRLTGTRRAIETCPGRQTAARPGQLRRPQLAGLESSHDLVPAPAFLSAAGQAGTHEKARSDTVPGRGESQGRAGLVVLPTAERLRTVAGDSGLLAAWLAMRPPPFSQTAILGETATITSRCSASQARGREFS